MGREKSDGRMVPQAFRKSGKTASDMLMRGGKATTASQRVVIEQGFNGTADSPKGAVANAVGGQPPSAASAVPKPLNTSTKARPTMMTMEEIACDENLMRSFKQIATNKGAPGPDGQSVDDVREHLVTILPELRRSLLEGDYRPGFIRRVWIPKPGGQRGLGIPDVIDRIVQQAVHQVLSPHFDATFHPSSHGFRPKRGCHTAIAAAKQHIENGYEIVVDLDLARFFDQIPHDRLLARLRQRVDDPRVIKLIQRMLEAKVVLPDGVVVNTEEGAPQGGPLSPLLSNIVLDELDWELDRRGHRFVRYADDCNVYVRSRRAGERVMASIVRFIEGRMRLKVNVDKSAVDRPQNRHFLGFRLRLLPWADQVEVMLSKRSLERIENRINELTPRNWGSSLRDCIQRLNQYLRGWFGFFKICTSAEGPLLARLDAHIRRRLRALVLKHWRRKRTIARRLIQLGIKPRTAWRNVYDGARSWWALSRSPAVNRALCNAYFAERGLFSLRTAWVQLQADINAPRQLELPLG
jgi:RNA-directed DNA polymerase